MNEKDYNFVLSEVKLLSNEGDNFNFVMPVTSRGKTAIFVEIFDNAYRIEANDIVDGAFEPIGCLTDSGAEFGDYTKFMDESSKMYHKLAHPCYYDVVLSVYEKNGRKVDCRVDSHFISGGFDTDYEAEVYIQDKECELGDDEILADKYLDEFQLYTDDEHYAVIEIEEHSLEGYCTQVVSVY